MISSLISAASIILAAILIPVLTQVVPAWRKIRRHGHIIAIRPRVSFSYEGATVVTDWRDAVRYSKECNVILRTTREDWISKSDFEIVDVIENPRQILATDLPTLKSILDDPIT